MQLNSYIFILAFLPVFIVVYYLGNRISIMAGRWIIIIAGLVFYYFAGIKSFIILLLSMVINYILATLITKTAKNSKIIFILTIILNAGLLLFYKYLGFMSALAPADESAATDTVQEIIMPLGISFFTFQQIMYVVGVYRKEIDGVNPLDYAAYILYFPKLIMGPLVEPTEIIDKINDPGLKRINYDNIASGIKLFSFGLFKKMVLADTFMRGVDWGFMHLYETTSADLILTMLFYTFEIYFDFSGYTDMATGVSKMLNIDLPINFDSPYKATSIQEFWKRWHVSLTKFFTKYIYYPLGGNRKGKIRTYVNIMVVFLVSGLWHGANITFILWGLIHGFLQVLERFFARSFNKVSEAARWIYTFGAVNVLWMLFRSDTIIQWHTILYRILTFQSTEISEGMQESFWLPESSIMFDLLHLNEINDQIRGFSMLIFTLTGFILCLVPENNYRAMEKKNVVNMMLAATAFVWGFMCLSSESIFVYNNF